MICIKKTVIVLALLALCSGNAIGADTSSQKRRGRHQGPPPEAYTVCENKSVGESAQFVNPRGDTITGICKKKGVQLVLRPDSRKGASGGRQHGPPPEAYAACESKAVGDLAQFVSPRGDTVKGTCEQGGDKLVLRPDRSMKKYSRQGSK